MAYLTDIEISHLDQKLTRLGYKYFGGLTNCVYRSKQQEEILKLGVDIDPINLRGELAAFQGCQEISHIYAPKRLMPLVFAVGDNFQGTGYPFLQEQYVPSKNMSTAFLENPVYWEEHIPNELVTIYQSIQTTSSADTAETWQDKIDGMLCPKGSDDWYELVLQMGEN